MVSEAPVALGANLTAAMCKKSNRVARVLVYALLEWILITLVLANGIFSYLISKFTAFFGLTPPCALCSHLGVDSLFKPHSRRPGAEPLRRVLCDGHAAEMSRLGYYGAHRRLADAANMCEDCTATAAAASGKSLLSWMRRSELDERDLACTCCGVALESGFYSSRVRGAGSASGWVERNAWRMWTTRQRGPTEGERSVRSIREEPIALFK